MVLGQLGGRRHHVRAAPESRGRDGVHRGGSNSAELWSCPDQMLIGEPCSTSYIPPSLSPHLHLNTSLMLFFSSSPL